MISTLLSRRTSTTIISITNININNNTRLLSLLSTKTTTRTRSIHVDHYQSDEDVLNKNNVNSKTGSRSSQTITNNTTNNNDDDDNNNKSASASTARRSSRSRRSRSGGSSGPKKQRLVDEKQIPSYKEFVHRFTVLSLYRGYLKTIRESMPHNQQDLLQEVRKEFHANKNTIDPITIQREIKEGQRRYEELQEFTGQSNKYEGPSWINTKDTEDPRGRVGTGWPWSK
ncbi:hypothetical protein FRACYDRAFT_257306 [Fragilariopsis cylindrus CCMP1102]|uniref:LYR motif-containing protein 2 n=1 Tax=Fragilariopsis cylindrus CCMP1102 TaxID=635003 RepID=A0A1E7EJ56_9STRA|nr:hypothetical protein FRACYDRAFT_257306 [Fragilariopsis cylindrus CCMP1102]|eukprot:OEU05927.1 hypothetical protein FRACYDRAFT_257306 [Fragilariopsis cylindrus CCMP1102]